MSRKASLAITVFGDRDRTVARITKRYSAGQVTARVPLNAAGRAAFRAHPPRSVDALIVVHDVGAGRGDVEHAYALGRTFRG